MTTTFIILDFSINNPNTKLVLPLHGFTGTIRWSNIESDIFQYNNVEYPSKFYANSGNYTISLINVTQLLHFGQINSEYKMCEVYQTSLTKFSYLNQIVSLIDFTFAFAWCTNNFLFLVETGVTSNVRIMTCMFQSSLFNQPVDKLDTSNVTNFDGMFSDTLFNQPVNNLNTSKGRLMTYMFFKAKEFNQSINEFNLSNMVDMAHMFEYATLFNQPILTDPPVLANTSFMFREAISFNQPIKFTSSNIFTTACMFLNATSFNSSLILNTSSVIDMSCMFQDATSFNQPILFNTIKTQSMFWMFKNASSFNQPLNLNCGVCFNMVSFLDGATQFNNSLNLTPIFSLTDATDMLINTNLSTINYSNLLNLWGTQTSQSLKENVILTATNIKYNLSAKLARDYLTFGYKWNITDGGEAPLTPTIISITSAIINKKIDDTDFNLNALTDNNAPITYISSNINIVTVNNLGIVTIVSKGTATIQLNVDSTIYYGSANATITINVSPSSAIINITTHVFNKKYGDYPFNTNVSADAPIKYTSSNTSVVIINNEGICTIVSNGTAIIQLIVDSTDEYGSSNASITINVSTYYSIHICSLDNILYFSGYFLVNELNIINEFYDSASPEKINICINNSNLQIDNLFNTFYKKFSINGLNINTTQNTFFKSLNNNEANIYYNGFKNVCKSYLRVNNELLNINENTVNIFVNKLFFRHIIMGDTNLQNFYLRPLAITVGALEASLGTSTIPFDFNALVTSNVTTDFLKSTFFYNSDGVSFKTVYTSVEPFGNPSLFTNSIVSFGKTDTTSSTTPLATDYFQYLNTKMFPNVGSTIIFENETEIINGLNVDLSTAINTVLYNLTSNSPNNDVNNPARLIYKQLFSTSVDRFNNQIFDADGWSSIPFYSGDSLSVPTTVTAAETQHLTTGVEPISSRIYNLNIVAYDPIV